MPLESNCVIYVCDLILQSDKRHTDHVMSLWLLVASGENVTSLERHLPSASSTLGQRDDCGFSFSCISGYYKLTNIVVRTSPHLSSSGPVVHKAEVHLLQLALSAVTRLASFQLFHHSMRLSFSIADRHVVLGRPTFLLPSVVQVNAVVLVHS